MLIIRVGLVACKLLICLVDAGDDGELARIANILAMAFHIRIKTFLKCLANVTQV